ncbi:hypothetical protein [Parvicella tangerina]|uniref:Uncharacterized protein n=1 Tax=Parvicella tangerina TaxID=2829795 RepID=A0A916JPF0_9FLAO|nr:hypothetical protein [Parvicella tangerina]CAG5085617.1 hypothetical protein CRYO30217_02815 [Parvicella tangerina]
MSEEVEAIKNAIDLNRQSLVETMLGHLGVDEIDEQTFQELKLMVEYADHERLKYLKALETQEVVEYFLKDKLV